tara:strand:+ start:250 stop:399 length:150 start_codon:yes stop_codon:yes gene_type:complete
LQKYSVAFYLIIEISVKIASSWRNYKIKSRDSVVSYRKKLDLLRVMVYL